MRLRGLPRCNRGLRSPQRKVCGARQKGREAGQSKEVPPLLSALSWPHPNMLPFWPPSPSSLPLPPPSLIGLTPGQGEVPDRRGVGSGR